LHFQSLYCQLTCLLAGYTTKGPHDGFIILRARPVVVDSSALLPGEPFLFQACGSALPPPQEVELGAADVGVPSDLDSLNARRMQGKCSFHPDAVRRYAPDCEVGVGAAPLADAHDRATHQLDSFAVAFNDAETDFDVVPNSQVGQVRLESNVVFLLLFF
jgi:hypothetical protein